MIAGYVGHWTVTRDVAEK